MFFSRTLPDGTPWNLATPSIYGLPNTTRNLRIPVPGGELGAWLMEPDGVEEENDKPMVLYLLRIAQEIWIIFYLVDVSISGKVM